MTEQDSNTTHTNNNWLRAITPCLLGALFCVYAVIVSILDLEKSGGWSMAGVIVYFPALLIILFIDIVVKRFFQKMLVVWAIEIGLLAIGVLVLFKYV